MIETICKVLDRIEIDGKEYFKLLDSKTKEDYVVPLNQLFNNNLYIGSEYKFFKQYNSKTQKYFLVQQHPFYKLNWNYEFNIVRKELDDSNKIETFFVEDNDKSQIRVRALKFQQDIWEKKTLTCQVIAFSKNGLVLRNSDFSNLPYIIGSTYEFKIKGFGEYENNKNTIVSSIILESSDGSEISVTAFKWQNEKIWKYSTVFCEVLKFNSSGLPYLKNVDERHPIFEIGKIYDFKVVDLKTKLALNSNKKYNIIELLGIDDCKHETNALPGQMRTLKVGDNVQCIIKSIGYNLQLNQVNIKDPYFAPITEIIHNKELITKYFDKALSDENDDDSVELAVKYNSESAFWVFTFCNKILTRYFKDYSERYDYKSSKEIAELIIDIEKWIITSGIITSFPSKEARKNTIAKANQQLEKYSRIYDILTILEELDLNDFLSKRHNQVSSSHIEDLYYILMFSDINQVEETLFVSYLTDILSKLEFDTSNSYFLKKLDNSLQFNKRVLYKDEYEKSFNLSFDKNSLFDNESEKNKYFALSFCQFLINEKIKNFERANYILGKLLRQLFYSTSDICLKEKLLFSAYYYQNNNLQINEHPIVFKDSLIIDESKLPENPNCCHNNDEGWIHIKDSFENKIFIEVKAIKKEFNGFVVDFKGIYGFLPFNHITDNSLKYYSYSKIDFTLTIQCILISEEFNFFIAKQPSRSSSEFVCNNNLLGQVKIGDIVEGKVKSIEKYGVFITSYWGDGLLHIKNISTHFWDKEKLLTYFNKGDLISTKVISIDGNKIGLSFIDLINTEEEDKYFDFINFVDFGDVFTKVNEEPESNEVTEDDEEIKYNQLEKAFCFEQYAMLKKSPDEKIHYLRLSKQFFSSINNPRSYLINIYTNYFELLKLIGDVVNDFSIEKIVNIKSDAQLIYEKVKSQEQTLEVFPDSKKLIFFINIISLFNDTSEMGIQSLYELLQKNSNQKVLKTIAKIALANNLLISESDENPDFVRKNLKHIKSYLDDGVLSLKETETDKLERELREKVKYWTDRIKEDEGETQEFKSSFFTPIPDESKLKEKANLLEILAKSEKKDSILKKLDLIDGKLASKAVIHSSLKTLCAFANTNGGSLLIGIADNKTTVGLEVDYLNLKGKKNRDGFGLFFDQKIKEYFEPSFSSLLEREFLKLPGGDILIVSVRKSVEPVFLLKDKEGNPSEELFVRDLTSTKEIVEKRDLVKFVKQKEKEYLKTKIDD